MFILPKGSVLSHSHSGTQADGAATVWNVSCFYAKQHTNSLNCSYFIDQHMSPEHAWIQSHHVKKEWKSEYLWTLLWSFENFYTFLLGEGSQKDRKVKRNRSIELRKAKNRLEMQIWENVLEKDGICGDNF